MKSKRCGQHNLVSSVGCDIVSIYYVIIKMFVHENTRTATAIILSQVGKYGFNHNRGVKIIISHNQTFSLFYFKLFETIIIMINLFCCCC